MKNIKYVCAFIICIVLNKNYACECEGLKKNVDALKLENDERAAAFDKDIEELNKEKTKTMTKKYFLKLFCI